MAQLTVTVPDPQVPRIQVAFGKMLQTVDGNGDPRDATAEEVRQFLVDTLKESVLSQEQKDAATTASDGVTPIDAT